MRKRNSFVGLVITLFSVLIMLSGCSWMGAPATTEELLVRYVAAENVDNFHATATLDMSVSTLGVRAVIPVTADLNAANNKAHGTLTVDLASLDTRNYVMELYAELTDNAIECYLGTPHADATQWKSWTIPMTSKLDIVTLTDLLSASELTIVAKGSDPQVAYELTVPTTKVLQTAFELDADPVEVGGMDEAAMMDAMGSDKVRVDFTKDCLLRSISASALLNLKSAETNNVPVRLDVDISAVLDHYGQIDSAEVETPRKIRDSAVPTDEPIDVMDVLGAESPLAGAIA